VRLLTRSVLLFSTGALKAALSLAQEALAIAALLSPAGNQHGSAREEAATECEVNGSADAAEGEGDSAAGASTPARHSSSMDDILSGAGPAHVTALRLGALLSVGRLYDALGCADEASAALKSGLKKVRACVCVCVCVCVCICVLAWVAL
jgi:hypothetical protein